MNGLDEIALLVNRQKFDIALGKLREYLSIFPEESRTFYLISICYFGKNNLPYAKKYLKEAIRLDPEIPAYYNFAASLEKEDRAFSECLKLTDASLRLEPMQADPHLIRAQVAMIGDDFYHAHFCAKKALEIDPESTVAKNFIVTCLLQKKKFEEAEKLIFEVLSVDPEDHLANANLAEWKWFTGKHKESRLHYQELLKADPNNQNTQAALKRAIKYKNPLARLLFSFQIYSHKNQEIIGGVIYFVFVLILVYLAISQLLLGNFDANFTLGIFLSLFITLTFPYKNLPQLLNIVLLFDGLGKYLLTKMEKLMMPISTAFFFVGIFMIVHFYQTFQVLIFHRFTLLALSIIYLSGLFFDLTKFKRTKPFVILGGFYFFFLSLNLGYYFFPGMRGWFCGLIIACLILYNLLLRSQVNQAYPYE